MGEGQVRRVEEGASALQEVEVEAYGSLVVEEVEGVYGDEGGDLHRT